jgi:hypothetical protein
MYHKMHMAQRKHTKVKNLCVKKQSCELAHIPQLVWFETQSVIEFVFKVSHRWRSFNTDAMPKNCEAK